MRTRQSNSPTKYKKKRKTRQALMHHPRQPVNKFSFPAGQNGTGEKEKGKSTMTKENRIASTRYVALRWVGRSCYQRCLTERCWIGASSGEICRLIRCMSRGGSFDGGRSVFSIDSSIWWRVKFCKESFCLTCRRTSHFRHLPKRTSAEIYPGQKQS